MWREAGHDAEQARAGRVRALAAVVILVLFASACTSNDSENDSGGTAPDEDATQITRDRVDASFGTLDDIVDDVMGATSVPGVAVAVVYDDETLYEQGYGVRSVDSDEPVEPETVFQIASLSKPVSSTIVAGLAGDGVLAWDQPIVEYAPEFQLNDEWVTDHVTFADLFAHRSGIPGGPAGNDLEAVGYDRATILERLRLVPLDPFRITYSYSNFGMTMAGEAAARAADRTWEEVSEEVLFSPAGMTSTSMRYDDFAAQENRAALHVELDGEWAAAFERFPDAQAPAGGVSSNVIDLARWMRLTLAGGALDGTQIIDAETLDSTHTPQIMSRPPTPTIAGPAAFYGLGWGIDTDATGATRWNHSGAFSTGASTVASLLPAEGLGIVVLTNGSPIGAGEAIADAYLEFLQTGELDVDGTLEMWGERFAGVYGEPAVEESQRPSDPSPARPDAAYVGTFANDYVGEVEIRAGEEGLELVVGPDTLVFPLDHWDGDTFVYADAPELPDFLSTVDFAFDESDEATGVSISAFDGAGQGTLVRT